MFNKGSLSAQRLLTAVKIHCPEYLVPVSRQLWLRIWSYVSWKQLVIITFFCIKINVRSSSGDNLHDYNYRSSFSAITVHLTLLWLHFQFSVISSIRTVSLLNLYHVFMVLSVIKVIQSPILFLLHSCVASRHDLVRGHRDIKHIIVIVF